MSMRTRTSFKKGHAPTFTKTGKDHPQFRHGAASTKMRDPLYSKWSGMKRRCFNKNEKCYKNWGGRGITVCKEWLAFENFARDMGPSFKKGLSLDRINVNGNYEPSNCRWIPLADQNKNKSTVKLYDFNGRKVSLGGLEREFNLSRGLVYHRVKRLGWSIEKALKVPAKSSIARL